jgi:hypothetical protein
VSLLLALLTGAGLIIRVRVGVSVLIDGSFDLDRGELALLVRGDEDELRLGDLDPDLGEVCGARGDDALPGDFLRCISRP